MNARVANLNYESRLIIGSDERAEAGRREVLVLKVQFQREPETKDVPDIACALNDFNRSREIITRIKKKEIEVIESSGTAEAGIYESYSSFRKDEHGWHYRMGVVISRDIHGMKQGSLISSGTVIFGGPVLDRVLNM